MRDKRIQDGIYYDRQPFHALHASDNNSVSNNSFAMLFLRVSKSSVDDVMTSIRRLWTMFENLKSGYSYELSNCSFPSGELTVLIGYGNRMFELPGITKKIPRDFKGTQFLPQRKGSPILPGSDLRYSDEIHHNVGLSEHICLQFISRTQLGVYRAIVETKKYLQENKKQPLKFSRFFTGFQRDDGRSWLGFHDEVSNMRTSEERLDAIIIHPHNNNLVTRDFWTIDGTYLVYLRTEFNLDIWNTIGRTGQELLIGRSKLSGSPLAGVDHSGNPIPVTSTSAYDVKGFDKSFHDHPDYFKKPKVSRKTNLLLDTQKSSEILSQSHIGRARHIDKIDSKNRLSRRIYRQGFEFLDPVHKGRRKLRVGLNFISFQNDPARLFFILTHPDWMGNINFGGTQHNKKTNNLLSVLAAGVFFVPPKEKPFPGVTLFER